AAWADVARRIAHEIKNPLTPIQLSAERLQRRYGDKIAEGDEVFSKLTSTIVRQVGDLRNMVDEFSSFARMPKPVFRPERIDEIARETLFLQEVGHPGISYGMVRDDELPDLVCDRRQIAQAFTNLLKNAAEATEENETNGMPKPDIQMRLRQKSGLLIAETCDNGPGMPEHLRERVTEPYVTTRAKGTGLGLAIVSKIVEEHGGILSFHDRGEGSGTCVRMAFDPAALARLGATDQNG
ncbi:MAG: ATP-binding protein, partial [Pacificimonas sp.]